MQNNTEFLRSNPYFLSITPPITCIDKNKVSVVGKERGHEKEWMNDLVKSVMPKKF